MNTPIVFDPTVDALNQIVAETAKIIVLDLADETQLALVHDTRIKLRDARVTIQKQGKAMREDALKYQKDVIAREKELIAIIDPEETRLKNLEEKANTIKERKAREALLPMRKEQLAKLDVVITDESILDMDNDEFVAFLNEQTTLKNEADRFAIEEEKAKLARDAEIKAAEDAAVARERDRLELVRAQEENARVTALAREESERQKAIEQQKMDAQKIIDDADAEAARIVQAAKDKIIQEQADKTAAEEVASAVAATREKEIKYQLWLGNIGYKKEDAVEWRFETTNGITAAFKLVDVFKN